MAKLQRVQLQVKNAETQLTLSDPELKLKQGYSMLLTASGKVVKSWQDVAVGDVVTSKVYGGIIESQVQTTKGKKI